MRSTRIVMTALLLGTLACDAMEPDRFAAVRQELRTERTAWQSLAITEYTFTTRRLCFCLEANEPYRIHVRNDSVVDVVHAATGEAPEPFLRGSFRTVDGLFALIEDAIRQDAASISVVYDAARHYPQSIGIDYRELLADDELGNEIDEFVPGPPPSAAR